MDQITEQFKQASQKQLAYIEAVSQAFQGQCEKLKIDTEQKISALDATKPESKEMEIDLKLKLKKDLKVVLTQYEKELKRSFGVGIVELEGIYHQKEFQRLEEIEKEILAM